MEQTSDCCRKGACSILGPDDTTTAYSNTAIQQHSLDINQTEMIDFRTWSTFIVTELSLCLQLPILVRCLQSLHRNTDYMKAYPKRYNKLVTCKSRPSLQSPLTRKLTPHNMGKCWKCTQIYMFACASWSLCVTRLPCLFVCYRRKHIAAVPETMQVPGRQAQHFAAQLAYMQGAPEYSAQNSLY
jgi:hypothetical protein